MPQTRPVTGSISSLPGVTLLGRNESGSKRLIRHHSWHLREPFTNHPREELAQCAHRRMVMTYTHNETLSRAPAFNHKPVRGSTVLIRLSCREPSLWQGNHHPASHTRWCFRFTLNNGATFLLTFTDMEHGGRQMRQPGHKMDSKVLLRVFSANEQEAPLTETWVRTKGATRTMPRQIHKYLLSFAAQGCGVASLAEGADMPMTQCVLCRLGQRFVICSGCR